MHAVSYAGTTFLTNSGLADALLDYARALALVNQSDVVRVPGIDEGGVLRRYALILGPASSIITRGVDAAEVETDAAEVVRDLERRQEQHLPLLDAEPFPDLAHEEAPQDPGEDPR